MGDILTILSNVRVNMAQYDGSRTGSSYNFAIAKDRNIVSKPKWSYKASRMYTTSTDSERHHCLLNIQDGGK